MTPDPCPNPAYLAEFVDGRTAAAERGTLTAHIASCPDCYEIVTGTARFLEEEQPALAKLHLPRPRRWWLATAAAATVAATVGLLWHQIWRANPIERLAAAARSAEFRPSEGRLVGFAYAPIRPATRAVTPEETEASLLQMHGVAGEVLEQEESSLDTRSLHAAGIAYLLVGNERRAVEKLEAATRQGQGQARAWSDLAAARLALARDLDSPELFPEALAAADAALDIDAQLPEGLFNRARSLDAMRLSKPAIAAYQKFLQVQSDSSWADEARQRIEELKAISRSGLWKQALPRLEKFATASDEAAVRSIVDAFRQDARVWGETEVLGQWAEAEGNGEWARAAERLKLARLVGDALLRVNGESILREAVKAIDDADAARRKLLSGGHRSYRTGRELYSRRDTTASRPHLQKSRQSFRAAGSPMWMLADFYFAVAEQEQNWDESALSVVRTLRGSVPKNCRALHGMISWQEGTLLARNRRIHEAIAAHRDSLAQFEAIGERGNTAGIRALLGNELELSGESSEAWQHRIASFGMLAMAPETTRLQVALSTVAAEFYRKGDFAVVASISGVASELPPGSAPNRRVRADAFLWQALALHELNNPRAGQVLAKAKQEMALISDRIFRRSALSDISFAESRLISGRDPVRATELLSRVLAEPLPTRRFFAEPEVLLARSRTLAHMGRHDEALSDLREAAAAITALDRRGHPQNLSSLTYEVLDELVAALVKKGQVEETFAAADSARTHLFFERLRDASRRGEGGRIDMSALHSRIPADVLVLEYVALRDQLLIFELDRDNLQLSRIPIGAADLQAAITHWVRTLSSSRANPDLLAEKVGQLLIAPVADALQSKRAIIASLDPRLGPLPLAAVRYRGSYLIERYEVTVVPSVSLWASVSSEKSHSKPSALVVGDPVFNRSAFPQLLPLSAAAAEAREVANVYRDSVLLTGPHATRRAVVRHLPQHPVLHVASHAVANGRDPAYSFVLLSEEKEESGRLYGYEIAKLNLNTVSLVVLAGCKTAAPSPSDSFPSLTSAFVAAGAQNSIGTLWNTKDRVAQEFSLRLHRSLSADRSVSSVLRDVQLSMLRSGDAGLRTPGAWGAFQLITAGS